MESRTPTGFTGVACVKGHRRSEGPKWWIHLIHHLIVKSDSLSLFFPSMDACCISFHFVLFVCLFLYRRVERLQRHLLTFLLYYSIMCTNKPKLFVNTAEDVKKLKIWDVWAYREKGESKNTNINVVSQPSTSMPTYVSLFHIPVLHKCAYILCALSDTSASQSAPCFISPHCFLFLFDWHAILKRCLHHRGALDWTRLLDPTPSHVWRKTASSLLLYL